MPTGNVSETIQDGGLGIIAAAVSALHLILGVASAGTPTQLYSFSSVADIQTQVGFGPGPEAAALELSSPNSGGTVLFMPVTASVVGVSSAVTPVRVGTSTGTVATATAPFDSYVVIVQVASTGVGQLVTGGLVQVTYSLDGGLTTNQATLVPISGTFVIANTGITLTFSVSATTFDFGDKFTFSCKEPFYSSTDINNACTALGNANQLWSYAHFVGFPTASTSATNATASAAIAATIQSNFSTFANNGRYAHYIMDAPPSLDTDLQTSYLNFQDTRGRVVVGTEPLNSAITGRKLVRSHGWADSARWGSVRPSISAGQFNLGGLPGIVSLNRDERTATTKMFDSRFGVALTYIGQSGFFSDVGKTMAPAGSDFSLFMNGRVMDVACTLARSALFQYLNTPVRVNTTGTVGQPGGPGSILEQDARGIENFVTQQIRAILGPDITDLSVKVNRVDNILSAGLLRVQIRVIPFGYIQSISADLGFLNPSLVLS